MFDQVSDLQGDVVVKCKFVTAEELLSATQTLVHFTCATFLAHLEPHTDLGDYL